MASFFPATVYNEIIQKRSGKVRPEKEPFTVGFRNLSRLNFMKLLFVTSPVFPLSRNSPGNSVSALPRGDAVLQVVAVLPDVVVPLSPFVNLLTGLNPSHPAS